MFALVDPELHQAMGQVDNSDAPPGHVAHQHQRGYVLHGRLLRPAMVLVARQQQKADEGGVEAMDADDTQVVTHPMGSGDGPDD